MSDVILIRPGWTDFDEQDRIQGSLDLPLNQRGLKQVEGLTEQLRGSQLKVIYAGPSEPARSTAEAIGGELDIPVKELKGLRNLNQGLWQGLQIDDIRRKYPKVVRQWRDSPETICPPEGEAVSDALARASKALKKPLKSNGTFGIVASEPLATLIRCVVQGSKPEVPGPVCGGGREPHIEHLRTNGAAPPSDNSGKSKRLQKTKTVSETEGGGDTSK